MAQVILGLPGLSKPQNIELKLKHLVADVNCSQGQGTFIEDGCLVSDGFKQFCGLTKTEASTNSDKKAIQILVF